MITSNFCRSTLCRGFGKGNTKGPLLFFVGTVILWCYPMYFLRVSIRTASQYSSVVREVRFISMLFSTVHSIDVELAERCSLLLFLLERCDVAFVVGFCQAWPRVFADEYRILRSNYPQGKIYFYVFLALKRICAMLSGNLNHTDTSRLQK